MRSTPTPSAERRRSNAPIWGSLLLSSGAWSVHFVVSYYAAELVCEQLALFSFTATPPDAAFRIVLALFSLVSAFIALLGAGWSWSKRYSFGRQGPGAGRAGGLPEIMTGLGVFFAILIIIEAVPLFMIACGGG